MEDIQDFSTEHINPTNKDGKNSKYKISIIVSSVIILLLIAGCVYLFSNIKDKETENEQLQQLAELNKQEMEYQYEEFDQQYNELQQQLTNDSLIAQIESERRRTQQLLEELRNTKATDAAEITRLNKEIASLRKVLRHYVAQIQQQYNKATTQINALSTERNELLDKVDLAAQLDATGFQIIPKNKRGKLAKKIKDVKSFEFTFTIVKNVTAQNGQRPVYARILKPDGNVMGAKGTFEYENTMLEYTEKKDIEYTGEEQSVTMYSKVGEFLEAGTYRLSVFVDNQMIGETTYTFEK